MRTKLTCIKDTSQNAHCTLQIKLKEGLPFSSPFLFPASLLSSVRRVCHPASGEATGKRVIRAARLPSGLKGSYIYLGRSSVPPGLNQTGLDKTSFKYDSEPESHSLIQSGLRLYLTLTGSKLVSKIVFSEMSIGPLPGMSQPIRPTSFECPTSLC